MIADENAALVWYAVSRLQSFFAPEKLLVVDDKLKGHLKWEPRLTTDNSRAVVAEVRAAVSMMRVVDSVRIRVLEPSRVSGTHRGHYTAVPVSIEAGNERRWVLVSCE